LDGQIKWRMRTAAPASSSLRAFSGCVVALARGAALETPR
jgi:hypothetical protein